MTIQINGKSITLKYSFRGFMIYEKITGESFNPSGITEILIYFYSTVLASCKDINLDFDEFMDYIDEHPELLGEFSEWLTAVLGKNAYLNSSSKDNSKSKDDSNGEQVTSKTEEDPKKD